MTHETHDPATYVLRVQNDTRQWARGVLEENERLRAANVELAADKRSLLRDKLRLQESVIELREELDRRWSELDDLRGHLAKVEEDNRVYTAEYFKVEQQNTNLANLYVASYRLHGTLDRHEVLEAVQEIVINLIGCEEFGVYWLADGGAELVREASFGMDDGWLPAVPLDSGAIAHAFRSAELVLAEEPGAAARTEQEAHLTAAVPLRAGGRVRGVIAIFRLLPQKAGRIETLDRELFDLLADQAGTALYLTGRPNEAAVLSATVAS